MVATGDKRSLTPKQYYNKRKSALDLERQSFIPHYKELSEFIRPRRGRFFIQDRNRGTKRYNSIINSHGTQALRTATAGMLAGTMSPTRPWFALETPDESMMNDDEVRQWLYTVETIIRRILNESNFYGQASTFLSELLLFGTGSLFHVDDFENVARFYAHTVGSYYIAQDDNGRIDTYFREFEASVKQIVQWFGRENVSKAVGDAYDRGDYEGWYPVCHIIEPNSLYRAGSKMSKNKLFRSVYYEPTGADNANDGKLLSEMGFDEFPVHVARWDVTGEDVYGTDCPGMIALGDIKGLQVAEKRKGQAVDKMVNPPLTGPAAFQNVPLSSLPGYANLADAPGGEGSGLKALYQVQPRVNELRIDIEAIQRRIDKAFFVDLFLAISTMEGIQPRNELDLIQRNEERLLQLGPVLERLHGEFLMPMIDRTFNQGIRAGIFPPPPSALEGQALKIKFISTLAMAQRAVATQSIERLSGFVGGLVGAGFTNAAEKFDAEQAVDEYARSIGAPPSVVVPDKIVAERRQALQQKQALAEGLAAGQQAANIAKMASDAKTNDQSILTDVMENA